MTHSHDHHHDPVSYYQEQLLTIGICGLLGVVAVLTWYLGRLSFILHPFYQLPVLLGGIAVLGLVVVRGVTLWMAVGKKTQAPHHHDHDHGHHHHDHDHTHDHGHHHHDHAHAHDHDHHHEEGCCDHHHDHAGEQRVTLGEGLMAAAGPVQPPAAADQAITTTPPAAQAIAGQAPSAAHSPAPAVAPAPAAHDHAHDDHTHGHSWIPVRYIVLLLPPILFFLNLPNKTLDSSAIASSNVNLEGVRHDGSAGTGEIINLDFRELERAAFTQRSREFLENKSGRIKGQFRPEGPKHFQLVRWKWTHCAADAIPLNVPIVCQDRAPDLKPDSWVEVTGQIQFVPRKDGRGFAPILYVPSEDMIRQIQPEANPYIQ